jgi:two-component system, OmpR family, phosphate regulon response regulator PhoB
MSENPVAHIIVIEDEDDLRKVLEYNLEQAGHTVTGTGRGAEGLRLAQENRADLVLLDLMLPDMPGTQVCRALKAHADTSSIPVVMVTARGDEIDRVVGFEIGADDYVVKPFSMRELLLRISVVLRRHCLQPIPDSPEPIIEFGRLRMDRAAHRVWVDDQEIDFTVLEFRLLVALHDSRGRVQTRASLLQRVWGVQANNTTRTVDTHVKRLREKLESTRDYIETVRGVGYRFVACPEEVGA